MNIIHDIISDSWLNNNATAYGFKIVDGNIILQLVGKFTYDIVTVYFKPSPDSSRTHEQGFLYLNVIVNEHRPDDVYKYFNQDYIVNKHSVCTIIQNVLKGYARYIIQQ